MRQIRTLLYALAALTAAVPAYADGTTFASFVNGTLVTLVDTAIVPFLYALAFLFLIFGIFKYFFTGGQENRETARAYIVWALVGMVVLFSVWGILKLLLATIPLS